MENTSITEAYINIHNLLLALAANKFYCIIEYPNFRDVKVKIIEINFTNIEWTPVKVKILEKEILEEITVFEPMPFSMDEDAEMPVQKKAPLRETWVSAAWLKNFSTKPYNYDSKSN